jgi:aldehyde dehydrogenase (NAD+)
MEVDAVWSFSGHASPGEVERRAAGNLKRTWVETRGRDWARPDDRAFIDAATEVKTVWIPYGEG